MSEPKSATAAAITSLLGAHAGRRFAFLLDAGAAPRRSFVGSEPVEQLIVRRDGSALRWRGHAWERSDGEPLATIGAFIADTESTPQLAAGALDVAAGLHARTVGYLAYELGSAIENVTSVSRDPVGAPLAVLSAYAEVDAYDPSTGATAKLSFPPKRAPKKSDLAVPAGGPELEPASPPEDPAALRDRYRRGFARIHDAIACGEIYQANLTRSIDLPFGDEALACYLRLRARQAVPYGAYLDLGTLAVLSNSPECFLEIAGEDIATYPIKGTRARCDGADSDAAAIADLRRDPKERAEHVMIVDLERNDLGRVCRSGSVAVPEHASLLSLATVHHLVSKVVGKLKHDVGIADILRATFPGGSVTGAPKIQAMRTIAEVEPTARGIYTGVIGGFNGERRAELNIAIRTAVVARGRVVYGTGGGIVADSRLESEYEETVAKARAFLDSLAGPGIVGSRVARS